MNEAARLTVRVPTTKPAPSLCDALDQLLDTGVVVSGELRVKVADIDLLYVALELVACSHETAYQKVLPNRHLSDERSLPPQSTSRRKAVA
jgi:hypothetical protein